MFVDVQWVYGPKHSDLMEKVDNSNECPCVLYPYDSKCGNWEDNESACVCVDFGLVIDSGRPLYS